MRAKSKALRNVGLVIIITSFFVVLLSVVLTHPATIRYVLDSATAQSKWEIKFTNFDWRFFSSTIVLII
ncbi:MAG: hypothetical protein ABH859_05505 [Pseudomonadota bacterium]